MTRIKIFRASGAEEVRALDDVVNRWLASVALKEVISIAPNMCTIGGEALGELWQYMTITVVYRE